MSILKHKNFIAPIRYSEEDEVFVGRIEGINSVVSFEGKSIAELKEAFSEAVEIYLDFCKRKGIEPFKQYNGVFNVRINPETHRLADCRAKTLGMTFNGYIKDIIERDLLGRDINK